MKKYVLFFCIFSSLYANPVENLPAETLKESVCQVLPGLYGWCTPEKARNFIDLVLEVKPELCVEIGVFGGRSLFPVASALKFLGDGLVIGIDPWNTEETIRYFDPVRDRAHINWWSKVNMEQIYYSYLGLLAQHDLDEYCITLKTTSESAAPAIGPIDILYIDGNHSEGVSTQDVNLYLPKVRKGGYIWLNDSLWSDLQPAIDLLFEECDFIKLIDNGNCILFRKR